MGVNYINIRADYFRQEDFDCIKNIIVRIGAAFGIDLFKKQKVYGENIKLFDINFNEYSIRKIYRDKCYAISFWPTIAANLRVYPCAHIANEKFVDKSFDLNSYIDYYEFYKNITLADYIKCENSNMCPSIINYVNNELDLRK